MDVIELEVFDLKLKPEHSSKTHPDLPNKPGGPDNWVEGVGGLPSFIKRVAKHIFYDSPGMTVEHAVASAVSQCKEWAAKGNPKAIAAIAQWEAKKVRSHAKSLSTDSGGVEVVDLGGIGGKRGGSAHLGLTRRTPYSVAGNAASSTSSGVKGASFDESKHPRTFGGKWGAKVTPIELQAARRKIEGALTNLRPGQTFKLPNDVGWVKRGADGSYFIQGNGGFTASVRTLSEAIVASATLLVKRGTKQ